MSETREAVEPRIKFSVTNGVADIRLNRPDKMNALDPAMFDALIAAAGRVQNDPSIRAVILSGEGRGFCAGLDFSGFSSMASGTTSSLRDRTHADANKFQHAALCWRDLPVPVIAAIHGVAYGGGLQIILGADLRVAANDARFSIMEIKWGLVPDMGSMVVLPRLLRDDAIRELTYTGRVIGAAEAYGMGLVTRLCDDPREAAFEIALEIAAKNPDAVRAAKHLIGLKAGRAEILLAESIAQDKLIGSPNQKEAVRAALAGEVANFVDSGTNTGLPADQ